LTFVVQTTELGLQLETLELSMAEDDNKALEEFEVLSRELASVEQSLATLRRKNAVLQSQAEKKQKAVVDQKKLIDVRQSQIDSVNQKVSALEEVKFV
jgi:uncharacterized protein YydD (DUF2326 family)